MAKNTDYDIIIIGAGPAGLSLCNNLEDTGLKIAILDKQKKKDLADPAYDGREIAITHFSHDIMQETGVWDLMPKEHISLIKRAKVMNGDSLYSLDFDHEETSRDNLGFMVSNHYIRKASYEKMKKLKNVELIDGVGVTDTQTDRYDGLVTLDDCRVLSAKLIIAADSRFSKTRQKMGISTSMLDFGRVCIVGKLSYEGEHYDTAFECFHYDRTLAILPLNNKEVSIVVTLNSEDKDTFLSMDKEELARDVERRTQGKFGKMSLCTDLHPYPLVSIYAKKFYTNRFAIIGDAAVGMHPVTAHGFNLGLRGAHTLAGQIKDALACGGDIGAQFVLRSYARKHDLVCRPLYHGTNTLVKLYTDTRPIAKFARTALLRLGNRLQPAKKVIMNQLTEIHN